MSRDLEHQEQCAVIQWRDYNLSKYPELALLYAIPNGGKRHVSVAVKLKKEGVLSGVSDLFLAVARQGFHGLYIEMKAGKGCYASKEQKWFMAAVIEQGYRAELCRGADEAIAVLVDYLSRANPTAP